MGDITYNDFPKCVVEMFDTESFSEKEVIDSIIGTWCMNSFSAAVEGQIRSKYDRAKREGKKEIVIDIEDAENMVLMNDRIQQTFALLWNYWKHNAQ